MLIVSSDIVHGGQCCFFPPLDSDSWIHRKLVPPSRCMIVLAGGSKAVFACLSFIPHVLNHFLTFLWMGFWDPQSPPCHPHQCSRNNGYCRLHWSNLPYLKWEKIFMMCCFLAHFIWVFVGPIGSNEWANWGFTKDLDLLRHQKMHCTWSLVLWHNKATEIFCICLARREERRVLAHLESLLVDKVVFPHALYVNFKHLQCE